jgi:hypothetical protein
VTITSIVSLALVEIVGYKGNAEIDGARLQQLSSAATATKTVIQQPICLLGLDTTGQAITSNGAPNADFSGCTVMSNSGSNCNGSDLKAFMGLLTSQQRCGVRQHSRSPVTDPTLHSAAIPTFGDQVLKFLSTESVTVTGLVARPDWDKVSDWTADLAGNTLICGDLH